METNKKLHRSDRQMIAGVCAGIAEYFGWKVGWFRLFFLVFSALSAAFPGTIVYIILWIIMPKRK